MNLPRISALLCWGLLATAPAVLSAPDKTTVLIPPTCENTIHRLSWRKEQKDGSLFFPYCWCLAFDVLEVKPHVPKNSWDDGGYDVEIKVKEVLREGTHTHEFAENDRFDNQKETTIAPGNRLTLCLFSRTGLNIKQYMRTLKGKTQVWAFNGNSFWNVDHGEREHFQIEDHFEPFKNEQFSEKDLVELTAQLEEKTVDPAEKIALIANYLRTRWPENRIAQYCHKDNRLIACGPVPGPEDYDYKNPNTQPKDFYLAGYLYPESTNLGEVMWAAYTGNKIPMHYGLIIKRGKDLWQLDRDEFKLDAAFSDEDALRKRIYDTLHYANEQCFFDHQRPPMNKEEAQHSMIYSTTPLPILPHWTTFEIVRPNNPTDSIQLKCQTAKGELRAILDNNKEIQDVTVNGERSQDWIESLAEANKQRTKVYGQ